MSVQIYSAELILFVSDPERSSLFYTKLLRKKPELQVSGMTEFILITGCKLGLMPCNGIAKILSPSLPHPENGSGIPRCELYLRVDDADAEYAHALSAGASPVSAAALRDWGDRVAYVADPDGHVIAFACSETDGINAGNHSG